MYLVCIFGFWTLVFGLCTPAFAPVRDDADHTEVIRMIEVQREEVKEAQRLEEEAKDDQEIDVQKTQVEQTVPRKKKDNKTAKPWRLLLVIVVLGIFILSRIKPSTKKD